VPAPTALPRDLPGLTSLRAVAALLVFGYHVGNGVFPNNALAGGYSGVAARTLQAGRGVPYWTAVPAVAFCAVGLLPHHGSPSGNSWTAPVWLIVIMFVAQAAVRGTMLFARAWMVYAGKVSFAFYLVHQLVLKQTFHLLGTGGPQALVAVAVAGGSAVLLHRLVEVPAHQAVVARSAASKETVPGDAVAA
jgi:peptidoglycan/LPS O-acetylase OafA/YrhL